MLAVIDTNVWISGLLAPQGFAARVIDAVADGRVRPVYCPKTLDELVGTYTSPKLNRRYHLSLEGLDRLVGLLATDGLEIPDPPEVPLCRDPKDDVFVALAIAARAEVLVTRDDDLKRDFAVQAHLVRAGVEVRTLREFLALLDVNG